jgi:perosamine synthetase
MRKPFIPIARPVLGAAERTAVGRVLRSGSLTQGQQVELFEGEFSGTVEARRCVAVASGSAALQLGLRAAGIGPGDEVVVPSFTFAATVHAIALCGAQPVFADIDARTLCLDPAAAAAVLTGRTAAIVAVHLYGHPADMTAINALAARHGLLAVEDACQAQGARYQGRPAGALADLAAVSFYPSKTMTTGEGGMLICADEKVAATARVLRNQGIDAAAGQVRLVGHNARMTDLAAAIGRAQLPQVDSFLRQRRVNAARWGAALPSGLVPYRAEDVEPAQQIYTIRPAERGAAQAALAADGIDSRVYYPVPVHLTEAYRRPGREPLVHTEAATAAVLSIPIGPFLRPAECARIERALARW